MSNKKSAFSTLTSITVGAIAGTAIALTPVAAFANEHGDETHECKCSGQKKADCEKEHGEHSCGGEAKCAGEKE